MDAGDKEPVELVGLFHSPECLEDAISELTSSGWDHADLSLLGQHRLLQPEQVEGDTTDLADDSAVGRHPPISDTDVRQGRTLMTSMAGLAAAFVASGATIMTGGSTLVAVIGAAAAGGGAGALAEALGRRAGAHRNRFLQEQMERGGILLWVKVAPTKTERKAREILSRCGSTDIHVHRLDRAESAGRRAQG